MPYQTPRFLRDYNSRSRALKIPYLTPCFSRKTKTLHITIRWEDNWSRLKTYISLQRSFLCLTIILNETCICKLLIEISIITFICKKLRSNYTSNGFKNLKWSRSHIVCRGLILKEGAWYRILGSHMWSLVWQAKFRLHMVICTPPPCAWLALRASLALAPVWLENSKTYACSEGWKETVNWCFSLNSF